MLAKTLLEIRVLWAETSLPLFAPHLGFHQDRHQPAEEGPAVLEALRPLANTPHLLVGDFNDLHPDEAVGCPPHGGTKQRQAASTAMGCCPPGAGLSLSGSSVQAVPR